MPDSLPAKAASTADPTPAVVSPTQIEADAATIYAYHRLSPITSARTLPKPADAIFVLCSLDTRVARYAAQLFLAGLAPWLIFSGNVGTLTQGRFTVSEAEHFASIAKEMGVPREKIMVEPRARNTGENVRFVYELLEGREMLNPDHPTDSGTVDVSAEDKSGEAWTASETIKRMILGALDGSMEFEVTSPPIAWADYPDAENPRELVISIMVGDLVRIREYPALGYQIEQEIPSQIWEAGMRLKAARFDRHLP
jgi:hypothetical protein